MPSIYKLKKDKLEEDAFSDTLHKRYDTALKNIKLPYSAYLEISYMRTPLPVTSALSTVTDLPV